MTQTANSQGLIEQHTPLPRLYWLGMMTLALLVRRALVMLQVANLRDDIDGYLALAQNVAQFGAYGQGSVALRGMVLPEAFRPPLYPLMLAICAWFEPDEVALVQVIAVLHVILGAMTVVAVLGTAWNLGLGRRSLLAALVVLVDPILLHHSTLLMTETLATFLASVVLWIAMRADWRESRVAWSLAGGCMGLASLSRPTFLVWIVLSTLWLILGSEFRQRRWSRTTSFLMAAAVMISPWAIRNWLHFGVPIVSTTHGGYTLHLANNPDFYSHLRHDTWGTAWDGRVATPDGRRAEFGLVHGYVPTRGLEADHWHYRQAWNAIRAEPGMFAYACVMRWGYLFQLAPHHVDPHESSTHRGARYAIGLWYAVLYVLALRGAWQIGRGWRRQPWAWNLLLVISFLLPHTVYWTNMRMRAPLMPVLALVAAVGTARTSSRQATEPASNAA